MHLVGFIIRVYRDARSPEREIRQGVTDLYILLMCDVVLYPTFCVLRISILVYANEKYYGGSEVRKESRDPMLHFFCFLVISLTFTLLTWRIW